MHHFRINAPKILTIPHSLTTHMSHKTNTKMSWKQTRHKTKRIHKDIPCCCFNALFHCWLLRELRFINRKCQNHTKMMRTQQLERASKNSFPSGPGPQNILSVLLHHPTDKFKLESYRLIIQAETKLKRFVIYLPGHHIKRFKVGKSFLRKYHRCILISNLRRLSFHCLYNPSMLLLKWFSLRVNHSLCIGHPTEQWPFKCCPCCILCKRFLVSNKQ